MQRMRSFNFFMQIFSFCLVFFVSKIMAVPDTISQSQSLSENQTLVSKNQNFELGFFTPGNSSNRYLGIWYKNIPVQTVVWVANREKPITDMSVVLLINYTTKDTLVLTQKNNTVLWSITSSRKPRKPVLQLLDSGNLVLRERHDENEDNYLWQSFDYPCDTLLQGMKIGMDFRTGLETRLTAWKNENDPSPGTFSGRMDVTNWPLSMHRIGSKKMFNVGPWNGLQYSGKPNTKADPIFEYIYFSDENQVYSTYRLVNNSVKARMVLNETTKKHLHLVWVEGEQRWRMYASLPRDFCDYYGACGANGNCDQGNFQPSCDCLRGFKPKSPKEWNGKNYKGGCVRDRPLNCQDDGFLKYVKMKVPDTEHSWLNQSMTLVQCRDKCLRNCSCMAYSNSDIRGEGSGCAMWFGDLIDLRIQPDAGQDLYVRVPASELETNIGSKVKIGIAVGGAVLCGLFFTLCFLCIRRRIATDKKNSAVVDHFNGLEEDADLPLFDFDLSSIASATNNFSVDNKLGEGGFGPVYKGTLKNGQKVAVKRLSRGSGQGWKEFKNEIALIAKLQHRNLVKLYGSCIQEGEKLLIYEYMPNKSLDFFIFDRIQRKLLNWSHRFSIIRGTAKGLLYLHQDSTLKIIHRDFKASNVLLDNKMNPKISDFGLARILEGDHSIETTCRVVGTYGYMAPEYAIDGKFSVKSDVFSFGVLLLEIVSGKKNKGNHHHKGSTNLIGQAWDLWTEKRPLELLDEFIKDCCNLSEALRCIHIGLLCLQQLPHDRPSMSCVVMMLNSEICLPQPKQPAIFVGEEYSSSYNNQFFSLNELSITVLEAR